MNKTISPKIMALTFGVLTIAFLSAFYVVAWQEPTQAPPGGNVAAPINVGPTGQSKEGGLILNTGGAANGLIIDQGNLCLGTDCRNNWPETGVITTYQMSARAYKSGNTYFSDTTSYACPGGSEAVQIYCKSIIIEAGCGWANFDVCGCSVGSTASLKQYVYGGFNCMEKMNSCIPASFPDGTERQCYLPDFSCEMQFQCGIVQTVGQ